MPRPVATPSPPFLLALAVLISLLHALLAVTATATKSMTSDEIAHLAAGHAYNLRSDFRLQPENGNLPQRIAALPMTLARVPFPPATLASWKTADVWNYGHTLFYAQGVSTDEWLFLGRGMIALVSAATGLLVFVWSRALFGWRGAFLSLALFVFCPTFLAHGALATSDLVMTFFFLASLGAWWRHLQRPGFAWAAVSAATLGVAFVAKFSAVLLAPMLALTGLVWAAGEAQRNGWRPVAARLVRTTFVHAVTTWAIIWFFYGFRFSAFAPALADGASFNHGWDWILPGMGWPGTVVVALRDWQVLPEAWLYGLTFVKQFSLARGAFLSGDYSTTGWVTFFPFAFAVKTPLGFLLLLAGGAIAAGVTLWRHRAASGLAASLVRLRPLTPLIALFAVYWFTSVTSNLNIGHRHIMPTYPVLFIAAGWLGRSLDFRRPALTATILAATLLHAGESLRARPHYLAYFNPIIGADNGWRHLVDSSLDWGQDLPGLKTWLDREARNEKVFLSYFGTGDPAYEGIRATALPALPEVGPKRKWHALTGGVYAISATMLQHVYAKLRGDWTLEWEREYQQLRAAEEDILAFQNDPAQHDRLLRAAPAANWTAAWQRYEQLRFARLCHALRVRGPDAQIGHSILLFRLSDADIAATTGAALKDWHAFIERAVSGAREQ